MTLPEEEHSRHVENWRKRPVGAVDGWEDGANSDGGKVAVDLDLSSAVLSVFIPGERKKEVEQHSQHFITIIRTK